MAGFLLIYAPSPGWAWSILGGLLLSTLLLSPDLDLIHSHPSRGWGVLRWIWWPYQRMLRHRGISHWPFLGTATRCLYLVVMLDLILSSGRLLWYLSSSGWQITSLSLASEAIHERRLFWVELADRHQRHLICGLLGLALGDLLHLFLDFFSSLRSRKKARHNPWKAPQRRPRRPRSMRRSQRL